MIGLPFSKLNVYVYILNIRPIKEMRIYKYLNKS